MLPDVRSGAWRVGELRGDRFRLTVAGVLIAEDLRGLTPLFWAHVLPYGEVKLNMTKRLALSATQPPDPDDEDR